MTSQCICISFEISYYSVV